MRLRVRTLTRKDFEVQIQPTHTIDEVKSLVTDATCIPLNGQRLVHKGKVLELGTVASNGVHDKDTCIIVVAKERKTNKSVPSPPQPAPTRQEIDAATIGIERHPMASTGPLIDEAAAPSGFRELMSAFATMGVTGAGVNGDNAAENLVALMNQTLGNAAGAEAGAHGLSFSGGSSVTVAGGGEGASIVVGGGGGGGDNDLPPPPPPVPTVDPSAQQQLIDMGFPEARSAKALLLNRNNTQLAMEWLFEHEGDADIDTPLTAEQLATLGRGGIPRAAAPLLAEEDAFQRMREMGFGEEDIGEALSVTGGDYEAACAWLLGERHSGGGDGGGEGADYAGVSQIHGAGMMGMPDVTSLLGPAVADPNVQARLANPRVVEALRSIVANPETMTDYFNDPEIEPVLAALMNPGAGGSGSGVSGGRGSLALPIVLGGGGDDVDNEEVEEEVVAYDNESDVPALNDDDDVAVDEETGEI